MTPMEDLPESPLPTLRLHRSRRVGATADAHYAFFLSSVCNVYSMRRLADAYIS